MLVRITLPEIHALKQELAASLAEAGSSDLLEAAARGLGWNTFNAARAELSGEASFSGEDASMRVVDGAAFARHLDERVALPAGPASSGDLERSDLGSAAPLFGALLRELPHRLLGRNRQECALIGLAAALKEGSGAVPTSYCFERVADFRIVCHLRYEGAEQFPTVVPPEASLRLMSREIAGMTALAWGPERVLHWRPTARNIPLMQAELTRALGRLLEDALGGADPPRAGGYRSYYVTLPDGVLGGDGAPDRAAAADFLAGNRAAAYYAPKAHRIGRGIAVVSFTCSRAAANGENNFEGVAEVVAWLPGAEPQVLFMDFDGDMTNLADAIVLAEEKARALAEFAESEFARGHADPDWRSAVTY